MSNNVIEDRATRLGEYIVENKATVRRAAKQFAVSKSTVHKDVSQRLKYIDSVLYKDVKNILAVNKDVYKRQVLRVIIHASFVLNRNSKFFNPINGLPHMPLE